MVGSGIAVAEGMRTGVAATVSMAGADGVMDIVRTGWGGFFGLQLAMATSNSGKRIKARFLDFIISPGIFKSYHMPVQAVYSMKTMNPLKGPGCRSVLFSNHPSTW